VKFNKQLSFHLVV